MEGLSSDKSRMSSEVVVRVSHRYSAPAERVFDAWLTPAQASRFLFRTRTGNVMQCDIEPGVGGGFTETDRPRKLVFDFSVLAYGDEATRVTVDVQPLGPMACELTLTHELGETHH